MTAKPHSEVLKNRSKNSRIDSNHPANKLLDLIISTYNLKNDADLARTLQLTPPQISKMRYGHLSVTGDMIIRFHEFTGWEVKDIKTKLGLPIAFA
ncbi:MAG TPA: hypothetical protein VJ652_15175 [Noviherbaspirillum sp.]|nr:hypothetical protein [Noviherbaspirillum sp.]